MVYGILTGRSLYPVWMVVLIPIVIYLLKPLVVRLLKGRARELVNDCYDNLTFFVFFTISTMVLWNSPINDRDMLRDRRSRIGIRGQLWNKKSDPFLRQVKKPYPLMPILWYSNKELMFNT